MSETRLEPLRDKIVVRQATREERTHGGLYLPQGAADSQHAIGVVVAVGGGRLTPHGETVPLLVKVGDRVVVAKYGLQGEIEVDGERLLVLSEDTVLGILREPVPILRGVDEGSGASASVTMEHFADDSELDRTIAKRELRKAEQEASLSDDHELGGGD